MSKSKRKQRLLGVIFYRASLDFFILQHNYNYVCRYIVAAAF